MGDTSIAIQKILIPKGSIVLFNNNPFSSFFLLYNSTPFVNFYFDFWERERNVSQLQKKHKSETNRRNKEFYNITIQVSFFFNLRIVTCTPSNFFRSIHIFCLPIYYVHAINVKFQINGEGSRFFVSTFDFFDYIFLFKLKIRSFLRNTKKTKANLIDNS